MKHKIAGLEMTPRRYYVVGRETDHGVLYMQTYTEGGMVPARHWGDLEYADRFGSRDEAERAAMYMTRWYGMGRQPSVWVVETICRKLED